MIQANELRIGNWVTELIKNRIVAIDGIESNQDFVWVNYLNGSGQYKVGINDIEPIPLTPEILEKCGFEITGQTEHPNNIWTKYGEESKFELEQIIHFFLYDNKCFGTQVNYLHQLQNIYFSLTGEELDVKL